MKKTLTVLAIGAALAATAAPHSFNQKQMLSHSAHSDKGRQSRMQAVQQRAAAHQQKAAMQ